MPSPSHQLRSIFGLLKASCISYFHAYLLWAPNSSRLQVWNFHGTTEIDPLDLDALDGPPNSPPCGHQALTPSSPIRLSRNSRNSMVWLMRRTSAKTWKRWQAERQTNDSWQKNIKPKIPSKAFRQYYQSGQSDKAAHAFCKHCEKKDIVDFKNGIQNVHPICGAMRKKFADSKERFRIPFCV